MSAAQRNAPAAASAEPRRSQDSIVGWVRGAFATVRLTLLALLLVGGGSLAVILAVYHPRLESLATADAGARNAHAGLLDEETGLRGFLLTQQDSFLQPYHQGQAEVTAGNAAVLDARLDSDVGSEFTAMLAAEERWVTGWADRVVRTPPPGFGSPAALEVFLQQGKSLFDQYRVVYATLIADLENRQSTALADEGHALIAALVIQMGFVAAMMAVTMREGRRLVAALGRPVQGLLETMHRIGAGDLDARPTRDGPIEIAEIGGGLGDMADHLARSRRALISREADLAAQADRLVLILDLTREIGGTLKLANVTESVARAAERVSGASRVLIWIAEAGGLRIAYDTGGPGGAPAPGRAANALVTQAATDGRTARTDAGGSEGCAVAVPMIFGGRVVGVIDLCGEAAAGLDAVSLAMLETLSTHAGSAIDAARLHAVTEQLSLTDALTGLPNRRQLDADLSTECDRARRYGRSLSLLMLDVDHFKAFNDSHGHQSGDEVLAELGQVLTESIRTSDSAYRYGGEEFAILVRDSNVDAASELAERLRERIADRFSSRPPGPVTASLGAAGLEQVAPEPAAIIGAADQALYAAKERGRNRVVRFPVTSGAPEPVTAPREAPHRPEGSETPHGGG